MRASKPNGKRSSWRATIRLPGCPTGASSRKSSTNAFVQASVLNLYDPDRAQTVTYAGELRTWSAFLDSAQADAAALKTTSGAGLMSAR